MTTSLIQFLSQDPESLAKAMEVLTRNKLEVYAMAKNMGRDYTQSRVVAFVDSKLVDILKQDDVAVSCKSGCSHCCYYHVDITTVEAERLSKHVTDDMIDRMRKQFLKGNAKWLTLSHADRRCVFLSEDNNCTVYNERPLSCRKYYVVSEPELCSVEHTPQEVQGAISMPAELFASAAFEVLGFGSMPDMILQKLNKL